ncbi:hypothetical protein CCU68_22465 [Pseudomonas gingeri NCPPB 3146 = LMG 5327]|uniref:Uncharacterized protein n=2 Tax=Pseudomonas gingeri TaxID=117681 RepID=A0A7Y8CCB6_9PSED|nr:MULTISPECIES: hypothetical protein [Pseudomonas]NVZ29484.1 hypothetical protein [Pseudomonas gingeri]NVZ66713.1 hypothetical protein [Pseudomonas gingeri]NVZ78784.1 hypothetical protein [Pseudomonas gingeri]NWA08665.1 hypothetical protein [Pseudomonas gingeri]NWC12807.1 hypothetical protein [Pseudomonas gingeri]
MDTQPASLVEPFARWPFSAMPWREVPVPQEDELGEDDTPDEPPPQTWKHPDDGKEMPERDRETPLKP